MFYIHNPSRNPYFNLALEEYALRYLPQDRSYFMLWQNDPAIIIGASQNTLEEINPVFVRRHGIHVVRRRSGGGAVYHDQGNLNFSFITDRAGRGAFDFQKFTVPVIRTLHKLGISSAFSNRNDLVIEARKFSGNAQYVSKDRLLHHGTLLVHSNLDHLQSALTVSKDKIQAKGIRSVRSRVTNISDHLGEQIPVDQLKNLLLAAIAEEEKDMTEYRLTAGDLTAVHRLMHERYLRRDWNFGSYSRFNVRRSHRFAAGKVDARIGVAGGRIERLKFYGDFFAHGDLGEFERRLTGLRRDRSEIKDVLDTLDVDHYFHRIEKEGLLDLIVW
ncbi:MAG: lipoate--protein ligase [Desulfobacteraceae bacterium]|nr:MAG: lipoate--protein ligase [Desulfobacteraceae bacterium]